MSKRVISHAEFASLPGGSRVIGSMKEGRAGGYYVSRDPNKPVEQGGSIEKTVDMGDAYGVRDHYNRVAEDAAKVVPTSGGGSRPATEADKDKIHQGVWTDSEEKKTYLDVSDRIGSRESFSGLRTALQAGIEHEQKAIWNASAGHELKTGSRDAQGNFSPAPGAQMTLNNLNRMDAEKKAWRNKTPNQKNKVKEEAIAELNSLKGKLG